MSYHWTPSRELTDHIAIHAKAEGLPLSQWIKKAVEEKIAQDSGPTDCEICKGKEAEENEQ